MKDPKQFDKGKNTFWILEFYDYILSHIVMFLGLENSNVFQYLRGFLELWEIQKALAIIALKEPWNAILVLIEKKKKP